MLMMMLMIHGEDEDDATHDATDEHYHLQHEDGFGEAGISRMPLSSPKHIIIHWDSEHNLQQPCNSY
jgi:hypothetical protein